MRALRKTRPGTPALTRYERVARRVSDLIDAGTLRAGARIPSVRAMADQMGLSMMTVLAGYRALEARGLIESRPRSGFYVLARLLRTAAPVYALPVPQVDPIRFASPAVRVPDRAWALFSQPARHDLTALGSGVPGAELLPAETLSKCLTRAVRRAPVAANDYCLGAGHEMLRKQIALHMLDAGCTVGPSEVVVTVGATEALSIALQAVASPGDTVAVESPGYFGFHAALERLKLKTLEVQSDPTTGLSLSAFERILQRYPAVRALLLCTTNSNPTGATMSDAHKASLVMLCKRSGVTIIEDDTFGDVAFGEHRARAAKSLAPDDVVYLSSLSKVLSPGYRIGWVAAGRHHACVLRNHSTAVLAVPTPVQMAVALFLSDGGMAHHLRRLRRHCAHTARLMREAIAGAFPDGTRVTNPLGGPFLWLELPWGCDSDGLLQGAAAHGFSLAPGRLFSSQDHYGRFLRLNTALQWTGPVHDAIRALASMVTRQLRKAGDRPVPARTTAR